MNRLGIIKAWILLVAIIVICYTFIFFSFSSALEINKDYFLGEKIKINLLGVEDYQIKIQTPSQNFLKQGSNDVFIFTPEEIGEYSFTLTYGDSRQIYSFEVFQEATDSPIINNDFFAPGEDLLQESGLNSEFENMDPERIKKVPSDIKQFKIGSNPVIEFSYNSSNSSKGIFNSFKKFVGFDRPDIKVYDVEDKLVDFDLTINEGTGNIQVIIDSVSSFRPGLYRVETTINENGNNTILENWFLWGVLALNFDSSIYSLGDDSFISIGVLDDDGRMVCDADLNLKIISPSGLVSEFNTHDNSIFTSDQCEFLGITNLPDYFAHYSLNEIGNYSVNLTAITQNGVRFIQDSFIVENNPRFEIKRKGPTRIFPFISNPMEIYIKANENYSGSIEEFVPSSFRIESQDDISIIDNQDLKKIVWNVDFVQGEIYKLSYEFDAPDISPEFYLLGSLNMEDYSELRRWQVASDAEITIDSSILDATDEHSTGSSLVFINNTNGYVFFIDSSGVASYRKTTDGGNSWGGPVTLTSQTDTFTVAVWYDRWTPRDTGNLIHIAFGETGGDTIYYKYLNTTNDVQRSEVSTGGDLGALSVDTQSPSIVKSTQGNLFISAGGSGGSSVEDVWKSTNNGTSWSLTSATFNNDANDEYNLMPLANGDILSIYLDASANSLLSRLYNETNDTWSGPTTIDASFIEGPALDSTSSWGATLNNNTNWVYLIGNNNPGNAAADMTAYLYNGSWSARTDVVTNIGVIGGDIFPSIDLTTGDVYAIYINGTAAGSETVYSKKSSDHMSNWGIQSGVSTTVDDLAHVRGNIMDMHRIYAVWYNDDLNDILGDTVFDIGLPIIQDLSTPKFSDYSVSSLYLTPLDYNKFILAWCDDTQDNIFVSNYNTNGSGEFRTVDSSAGSCSSAGTGNSVAVTALNSTAFVVAWYDSGDNDISYKIYDSNLTNITGDIDVDTDAGISISVSVAAFNSTAFVIAWHDDTSEDATFRAYSTSGTAISSEIDVDTNVGTDSNSVDVSALNSTAFVIAWFDDGGNANDVTFAVYSFDGNILSSDTDPDGSAGNSRAVSVAAFNSTAFAFAWSDQGSADSSFRTYLYNGTPVSALIDSDTDVGTGRSNWISITSYEGFVFSWYDSSTDIGISSRHYLFNGTDSSSQITVQSNSQQSNHVASEIASTGIQLCENAYVVALANTTTSAYWRAYYSNGTIWDGVCPTYVPQIFNVNVTNITITESTFNWDTNVKSNSTVNYGSTLALGNVAGNNIPVLNHSFSVSGLVGSTTYYYNITSCIDGRCNITGPYNFTTSEADITPPNVSLIYPSNGSNIDSLFEFNFIYNVTDNPLTSIASCGIYINGLLEQNDTAISKNINQTFNHYLSNGNYLWSIGCYDEFGNFGISNNRSINVNVTYFDFNARFWETFSSSSSINQTAEIYLNNTRDATQNTVQFNVNPLNLVNIVNATTSFFGANGAIIPGGSIATFSSSWTQTHANVELTWKLYIVNSTGEKLLCQNGDDNSGGTPLSAGTVTSTNNTCISSNIRLFPSDRIKVVTDGYNINTGTIRTVTHAWDAATSSFFDLNVSTEGFLNVNLSYPYSDPNIGLSNNFNATCTVSCSIGTCRNVLVYVQYNTSSQGWINLSSSGNLILGSGETNPHSGGNLSSLISTNFSIQGNAQSLNNLRCFARGSYDSNYSPVLGITVGAAGASVPIVNLTNPINGNWLGNSTVSLFYNASDVNNNIANATLILNGERNQTNQSNILNGQINNFTISLPDGQYNWTINVTDFTNLVGTDNRSRIFYVDTNPPIVNLTFPSNQTTFQESNLYFNFTVLDYMDSSLVCDLVIDGIVEDNDFIIANGTSNNRTINNVAIGVHLWNVTCIDDAGNNGTSQTLEFTVQDLPPRVSLITLNNTFNNTGNITLQYNATDNNGLIQSILILNGERNQTNQSNILNGQINNFTLFNLPEGVYTWNVNVTDTAGFNATNSTRMFTIDLNSPIISLNAPLNNSVSNSSSVSFNFTVIDSIDSSLICNLYVESSSDLNFATNNGSSNNRLISGLTDGSKIWNVTCIDDAGNSGISQIRTINITERPTIQLSTVNNTFFNTTNFNLSYIPSDNTGFNSCNLYLDGSFNKTNTTSISNGGQNNFSISGISSGQHTWYVSCNDSINLVNQSQIRAFTVDTNGLNIALISPENGDELFTSSVYFGYNVTDNIDPILVCDINVNGLIVNRSNAFNGALTNISVPFAQGGLKLWNVTCYDDALNTFTSLNSNFTLAFAPQVALNSPANNTITNLSTIAFAYDVLDDNDNIANATLILNGERNQTNQTFILNDATNNITVNLQDGFYNWTINVTDFTNLMSTVNFRTLTIDTIHPVLASSFPLNDSLFSTNNLTFNLTVSDNLDSNITCNLVIDESVESSFEVSNGSEISIYSIRGDGTYYWNFDCYDDAGNLNSTEIRTLNVEAPPNVTLLEPNAGISTKDISINFVYLPEDAIGIFSCSLYIDDQLNTTDSSVEANQNNSFSVSGISEGLRNWTVECIDVFPDFNSFNATTRNFTVDRTPPNILQNSPPNNSNVLRTTKLNFTSSDVLDLDGLLSCDVYIDNSLNFSTIANSGIPYSNFVTGHSLGMHNWNVTCEDDAGNINWSSNLVYNVTLADFAINITDISFNASNPVENDTLGINVTVHSLINVTVPNVTISFFQGDPGNGGVQLGSNYTSYDLEGLVDTVFSINWSVPLGTNQIYVHVDPPISSNGYIEEWNETNNFANNSATVSGWQFVYGNINELSFFNLSDSSNSDIISWAASNVSDGRIYVSDSESSVSWFSVYAIGKDSSGADTLNDFTDIDVLIEMTNFGDSVTNLYTNGGLPINLTNLYIFNRFISSVPLTNSTNNGNFMTGILWDSSDDVGDGQYSQDDSEDLIFMTSVNKGKVGAYGTYDYEIRIPAKLREYFDVEAKRVVFYTEVL